MNKSIIALLIITSSALAVDSISATTTEDARAVTIAMQEWENAKEKELHPHKIRTLRLKAAELGCASAREEIIRDLENSDLRKMEAAFLDAAELGGADVIAGLAKMLFSDKPGGRVSSDEGVPAPRHLAVIALSKLITEPSAPAIDLKRVRYDETDVEKWREWWRDNGEGHLLSMK